MPGQLVEARVSFRSYKRSGHHIFKGKLNSVTVYSTSGVVVRVFYTFVLLFFLFYFPFTRCNLLGCFYFFVFKILRSLTEERERLRKQRTADLMKDQLVRKRKRCDEDTSSLNGVSFLKAFENVRFKKARTFDDEFGDSEAGYDVDYYI